MFTSATLNGIDLLGQLGLNWGGTMQAAKDPTLRWQGQGGDSPFRDYRLWAGLAGAGATLLPIGSMGKRVAFDVSAGALHSFVGTETMRRAAIQRAQAGGGQLPGGQQAPAFGPPVQQVNTGPVASPFARFVPGMFR